MYNIHAVHKYYIFKECDYFNEKSDLDEKFVQVVEQNPKKFKFRFAYYALTVKHLSMRFPETTGNSLNFSSVYCI